MWKHATLAAAWLCCTHSAAAQDTATPETEPSISALAALIDSQKALIESQARQIEELQGRMKKVEELALESHNRLQAREGQAEQPTTSSAVEERIAQLERSIQGLSELPTDIVEAGEFPGSFRIPGTDAALKIGGKVQTTVVKTLGPLGVDDRFVTSSIPIEGTQEAGKGSRLVYTNQPSRLNFDLRTPTGVGSMRAFIEADFAGGDVNAFRLRHAYGQWGRLLGGQTWSTFSDPEAVPDGIDFEGLNAISFFRQAQVRYTGNWGDKRSYSIGFENPTPDVTGASGVNQVPDFIARLRLEPGEDAHLSILRRGGHLQVAVIGRQIRAEIPDRVNETVSTGGAGASLSGKLYAPWRDARDNFTFASYGGLGIGRYITDLRTLGGQDAVYDAESQSLEPLRVGAAYLGFQHWWSLDRRIRSTFTYGFSKVANLDIQPDDALSSTHRWSLNVSWSPILRIDIVAEYLFGNRKNKNGELGWSDQFQIGGTFRF
jgi:hypothetical protein